MPQNNNNFFISGSQSKNQSSSLLNSFFSFGNKNKPLNNSLKIVERKIEGQPNQLKLNHLSQQNREKVGNLIEGIIGKMNYNKEELLNKIEKLNAEIKSKESHAMNNQKINELKQTIRKLYYLLNQLYKLHQLPKNEKKMIIDDIRNHLIKNRSFLNVVNEVIRENQKIVNQVPVNQAPTPVNQVPVNQVPVPVNQVPVNQAPVNQVPVYQAPLNQTPIPVNQNRRPQEPNIFRNIGTIPTNSNLTTESSNEIPELAVSNETINQIIENENRNANASLSNLLKSEKGEEVITESDSEKKSKPRSVNRSRRLFTMLKKMNTIPLNEAKQKLEQY